MNRILTQVYLFLALCSPFAICNAQPVITSSAMVQLGESAPVQFATDAFNPGPSGSNVNWNFGQLQDDTLGFTWEALAPSSSPFLDSFPGANLAFRAPVQDGLQENWIYYNYDSGLQSLDLMGSAAIITDTAGQDTFYYVLTPNPKKVQTFPFTSGSSFTDNFNGHNTINVSNFTLVQSRTGTITVEADGYGSLVTPAGTFQNVLRVKTTEVITDSYMGFNTNQSITRYTWYSADEKYLLLHMDSIVVQPQGGPANYTESIFYRDGAPMVALDEAQLADEWGLNLYPNPAQNQVKVSYQLTDRSPARLVLRNLIGQELRGQEINTGLQTQQLDLQGISPGIYTLQIRQGENSATRKLVIH